MRLIERETLLAAYDAAHQGSPGGARKLIEQAPEIDAVPLEWLCQWLANSFGDRDEICFKCCRGREGHCPEDGELCKSPKAWREHILSCLQKEELDE